MSATASRSSPRPRFTRHNSLTLLGGPNGSRKPESTYLGWDAMVREWLDLTSGGANQIVNRLESIGLLREIPGYARNRRFRFEPYLRLFEEPQEARP